MVFMLEQWFSTPLLTKILLLTDALRPKWFLYHSFALIAPCSTAAFQHLTGLLWEKCLNLPKMEVSFFDCVAWERLRRASVPSWGRRRPRRGSARTPPTFGGGSRKPSAPIKGPQTTSRSGGEPSRPTERWQEEGSSGRGRRRRGA